VKASCPVAIGSRYNRNREKFECEIPEKEVDVDSNKYTIIPDADAYPDPYARTPTILDYHHAVSQKGGRKEKAKRNKKKGKHVSVFRSPKIEIEIE
jgi:hypothetical protein